MIFVCKVSLVSGWLLLLYTEQLLLHLSAWLFAPLFALPSCLCCPAASQTFRQSLAWCVKRETSSHRSSKEPRSSSRELWLIWKNSVSTLTTHNTLSVGHPCFGDVCVSVYLLYIFFRWKQTKAAAAAGAGAELDGFGWQRGGRPEPAADPGPAGGEQGQLGETPLWAAQPAGAQRTWWGSGYLKPHDCFSALTYPGKADWAILLYFRNTWPLRPPR